MKIGLFADAHYCHADVLCGTRRPSLSLSKIREAMDVFREASVDTCICLGDLTDHAPKDTKEDVLACFHEALDVIRSYNIPFYLVPGNHDYLMMTADELFEAGIKLWNALFGKQPEHSVTLWRKIPLNGVCKSVKCG